MKHILLFAYAMLLPWMSLQVMAEEVNDTITLVAEGSEDMPTGTYTLTFKHLQLKDASSEAVIKVRIGSNSQGGDLHITADRMYLDCAGTVTEIAAGMPAPLAAHDYTLLRSTKIRVYRDGVLYGDAIQKSYNDGKPRIVLANVSQVADYAFEVTNSSGVENPSETAYETDLTNMLTGFTNLSPDPYLNSGFDRSGADASGRPFWTANAKNNGWGSEIWASTDAFSGPLCVKLEGASKYSNKGAALKQPISFTGGTPYVVRAMVKSDDWEGMIGIGDESNFIHITDTKGKWQQIEALLIPKNSWNSGSTETFYVHNADYESAGTLLIDNIEVYKGLTGTSIGSNTKVVSANINASANWNPSHAVDVHRLGFTENNVETFSQMNNEKVSISGAPYFTRTFEGSKMYAIFLPNGLGNVTATGRFDYRDHYEYHLYHGLDFICQRLNLATGKFEYMTANDDIDAGGYIIQFADNYDGIPVRFDMSPQKPLPIDDTTYTFTMKGNTDYRLIPVESTQNLLFYDEDNQQFNTVGSLNSEAKGLRPFMPYITTTTDTKVIAPEGTTGIRLLNAAQGTDKRYLVRSMKGGVEVTGHGESLIHVYNMAGQRIQSVRLKEGRNFIHLERGIYLVAGEKVLAY